MKLKTFFPLGLLLVIILHSSFIPKEVKILNFGEFESRLHHDSDSLYVINFWATWCPPCVKELAYFQDIANKFVDKKIKVLLVSLDFPDQVDTRLIPFLARKNIDLEVLVLDDPNQNVWIDKVHKDWSGAIPATLIYNRMTRDFYEKTFTYEELEDIINSKIDDYENY